MSFTKMSADLDIISALDDQPNDVGGLTAEELKSKFDEGSGRIKDYLNNTLLPQLDETVAGITVPSWVNSVSGVTVNEITSPDTDKVPTNKAVLAAMSAAGYGDMLKASYDTDNDGIVDRAAKAAALESAMTLNVSGAVAGSVSSDGSGTASLSLAFAKEPETPLAVTAGGTGAADAAAARASLGVAAKWDLLATTGYTSLSSTYLGLPSRAADYNLFMCVFCPYTGDTWPYRTVDMIYLENQTQYIDSLVSEYAVDNKQPYIYHRTWAVSYSGGSPVAWFGYGQFYLLPDGGDTTDDRIFVPLYIFGTKV